MTNVIFCHNAKYFVLPSIIIALYYLDKGEDVFVIVDGANQKAFSAYGFSHLVRAPSSFNEEFLHSTRDVNLIFFHHGSDAIFNNFKRCLLHALNYKQKCFVSFMPDGLGNAMWGQSFVSQIESDLVIESNVLLRDVFAFDFIHSSMTSKFEKSKIRVLDTANLIGVGRSTKNLYPKVLSSIERAFSQPIIFVPYRPWGTESFHDGLYKFEGKKTLGLIYNDLINLVIAKYDLLDPIVLFRGDTRYQSESLKTFETINSKFEAVSIDNFIPDHFTLEFFLEELFGLKSDVFIINLDSTTCQTLPYMVRYSLENPYDSSSRHFVSLHGCPREILNKYCSPEHLINKKLMNKMKDFLERYTSMEIEMSHVISEENDDFSFWVEIK